MLWILITSALTMSNEQSKHMFSWRTWDNSPGIIKYSSLTSLVHDILLFSSFVYTIFDVAVIELRFNVPVTNILHSCQDIAFKYVRFLPNNELKSCLKLLAGTWQPFSYADPEEQMPFWYCILDLTLKVPSLLSKYFLFFRDNKACHLISQINWYTNKAWHFI